MSLGELSLAAVSGLLRRGEVSPVAVVEDALERITGLEPVVGAFVTVMGEQALAAARVAESEFSRGEYRGPLHGVPVSLKDLIFVRGVRNTAGSQAMADFVPEFDAAVVERLRAAGAIIVGKAQTYEFAMGPGTAYPFGRTRNPWDLERVTVGSSSGSAAGVSARMVFASLGTDTGGSIRGPASGCGVVGFKPSAGRVSRFGVLPLSWTLDHVGPLTRDVADAALTTRAVEGFDTRDSGSVEMPPVDTDAVVGGRVRGLRFGIPSGFFLDDVDPEFVTAFEDAVRVFEEAGMVRGSVTLPMIEQAQTAHSVLVLAESYSVHEELFRARSAQFGPGARRRVALASTVPASAYLRASRVRKVFQDEFRKAIDGRDVLLTLTSPEPPQRFGEQPAHQFGARHMARAGNRLTRMANLLGAPAVSVPCGFTGSGLPIGLQIVGRPGDDTTVLTVAHAYQQRTSWHTQAPPTAATAAVG
ncbi:amidase [Saccharopolyspora sp. ASAGF58]|uniref:amidase n=1 Tax=Saccharopolyspora sp. ASAGF58 TaxID=2719023 RepID=UPI0014402344|nr:amidase [Saccharopolyspora sp. ASAGF58]QIZ38611.1 Asp-tRNA(Asn)/Glu-tRNA(Gln) amidotransferase subunit GatA [Saccharopolyspora sp. ASAGF58]